MEEERSGEMCAERRFLLNLFASIHDYDDKVKAPSFGLSSFLVGWRSAQHECSNLWMQKKQAQLMVPEIANAVLMSYFLSRAACTCHVYRVSKIMLHGVS